MKHPLYSILFFTVLMTTPIYSSALDEQSTWNRGRELYYQGLKDEGALENALNIFNDLVQRGYREGVALTYQGSLTALKAQYVFWPQKKLSYAKEGLQLMDQGLALSKNDPEALFIHGTTCYYLPFFFNRNDDAHQSFKKIIDILPDHLENHDPQLTRNMLNFIIENAEINNDERRKTLDMMEKLDEL